MLGACGGGLTYIDIVVNYRCSIGLNDLVEVAEVGLGTRTDTGTGTALGLVFLALWQMYAE